MPTESESSFLLEVTDDAFAGSVVHLESEKRSGHDFRFLSVSNDKIGEILTVRGDGETVLHHGGIVLEHPASMVDVAAMVTLSAGNLDVTDGGMTVV